MTSMSNTSGSTNQKFRQISAKRLKPKFHLLNIRTKWFVSPLDNSAVNLDDLGEFGASDEHFLAFVRQFVRLKPEHLTRKWGAISRCELLNWIAEHGNPQRQPKFYPSKREAEISVAVPEISENLGGRAQTEISSLTPEDNTPPNDAA